MELNDISGAIIGAAIEVHRALGPGLLESAYQRCLPIELRARGLSLEVEIPVPLVYKGQAVDGEAFRMDLLVGDEVVVELKSVEELRDVHKKQLLTYLRLTDKRLGLLINFGAALIKDGISRVVNNLEE